MTIDPTKQLPGGDVNQAQIELSRVCQGLSFGGVVTKGIVANTDDPFVGNNALVLFDYAHWVTAPFECGLLTGKMSHWKLLGSSFCSALA